MICLIENGAAFLLPHGWPKLILACTTLQTISPNFDGVLGSSSQRPSLLIGYYLPLLSLLPLLLLLLLLFFITIAFVQIATVILLLLVLDIKANLL